MPIHRPRKKSGAPTSAPAPAPIGSGATGSGSTGSWRGRPVTLTEAWSKVTVVVLEREIAWLDHLIIDIKVRTGKYISRSELIRGLIEAAEQGGPDLSSFLPDEIAEGLGAAWGAAGNAAAARKRRRR